MKKDLTERGPTPGLTVPANPQEERQLCTFTMPVKSINKHRLTPPHASTLNPCLYYSNLLIFCLSFLFRLSISGHYQHCLRRILKPSGQLSGTGSWRLLFPTPQMMADESTSL